MKNNLKIFLFSLLLLITVYGLLVTKFSKGDQYFFRLQSWYAYASANDWVKADELEKQLDPSDTVLYKSTHRPEELKKYINTITLKPNKSVEDWLELARIQSILGKSDDAYKSISTAKSLDPIRDDIGQIYYQTAK